MRTMRMGMRGMRARMAMHMGGARNLRMHLITSTLGTLSTSVVMRITNIGMQQH